VDWLVEAYVSEKLAASIFRAEVLTARNTWRPPRGTTHRGVDGAGVAACANRTPAAAGLKDCHSDTCSGWTEVLDREQTFSKLSPNIHTSSHKPKHTSSYGTEDVVRETAQGY
jgi:hypothetical protein